MKLSDHVQHIKQLTRKAFDNQFSRLGIGAAKLLDAGLLAPKLQTKRTKIEELVRNHEGETGTFAQAREKALDELAFTLFNRIAAIKVMEARTLFPEVITKRPENGDRSFQHRDWLEQHPHRRNDELEGLRSFIKDAFDRLGTEIALYDRTYPYALLPHTVELNEIIDAFNAVEKDRDIDDHIWASDDILGWLYESYNIDKKREHKDSGAKTEYHKVSLQSQVYTPRWVVEFLVQNSLGKLYLEMYPQSEIRNRYKIANAPQKQERTPKPLPEVKLIDPASGSGNFLLYAFDFFYELYLDQIENYGADYDEDDVPALILENNVHGIDLDDRAIQLAQLGLYIKAKTHNRRAQIPAFKVVSSDFFLPDYDEVADLFEDGEQSIGESLRGLLREIWGDLQNAYRFGSLVRIEEKVNNKILHLESSATPLFANDDVQVYADFKVEFFPRIREAVNQYSGSRATQFIKGKTLDALTFLEIITQSFDVAVANPPYTDSGDFGPDLKGFIEANYKKPLKFNTNLYATFIKRCSELISVNGKIALIHPLTFMYIKTFEDVRKFIVEKFHINVFVDYGYSNLFGAVMIDTVFYILERTKNNQDSWFISLDQYTRTPQEKYKKDYCLEAIKDYMNNFVNKHNYVLPQSKLKIIDGWPFIYWISDAFREKFQSLALKNFSKVNSGINTGNNNKYIRYNWEILNSSRWIGYSKGGPYGKWIGNLWLKLDWHNNGEEIKKERGSALRNKESFFKAGITYSGSGNKGVSFRYLPENYICDMGGSYITPLSHFDNIPYLLAFANSKLSFYIADCLNPTVNTQVGDLERIPFIKPTVEYEKKVSNLSLNNIALKKITNSYKIVEPNFTTTPIYNFSENTLKSRLLSFLNFENIQLSLILINEAVINNLIFEVYDLSQEDRQQVEAKMGKSIGELPVFFDARSAYLETTNIENETVKTFIQDLSIAVFEEEQVQRIKSEFPALYQSNNDLEEFCIRHQVNPINVWYWFRESNVLPTGRAAEITLEFLADLIREILMDDEDGIVPLVRNAGEEILLDRIESKMQAKGFSTAQISQLDGLLGRPLNEYLENHFFRNLSDHLNLFMYLPKTPFIWHLSSGPHRGFECYLIIYKWSKDKLLLLKSVYIEKRERSLINRKTDLLNDNSAKGQNERDLIDKQLGEIAEFKRKIDDLLASDYDPKLDDGVGKNIAPLQKRGMIPYEVLNAKQLPKYLNADW